MSAQRLIGVESDRSVWEIDIATGVRTGIGTITANAGIIGSLTYDPGTGRLYGSSTSLDGLYRIDVTSWAATLVGQYAASNWYFHGLEWDHSTSTLYGVSSGLTECLYTIDTATGAATLVGPTGNAFSFPPGFPQLAYDPIQNVMWLTSAWNDSLYSVDRATGAITLVGPLNGPQNPSGLAYDIDNLTLYVVCAVTDTLYTVDTATGQTTVVGPMGAFNMIGLVYIPGAGRLERTPHGCGPTTILTVGHPSPGFAISTTLGGVAGSPFVGLGVTSLGLGSCGCTLGHEWAVAVPGASLSLPIPPNPMLVGVQVFIQGLDLLAPGGCVSPQHTMTDTITLTIG